MGIRQNLSHFPMPLNERAQRLLELEVFKGKIVERRKGRGGLVYIVESDSYPNRVAYKTIQEFENNLHVDTVRIDREARNWFLFAGHPLVIKPFFVEVWDDVPLICMPYCDGDLGAFIEKRLSLTGVVCLSLQIVKGMIAANRRGMDHHQDMKPENLLYMDLSKKFCDFPPPGVDPSVKYSVRIADFGVANAWRDNHRGGTNAYKAPEQHDATLYDAFAPDVFGVGLVIAELFQGYHPAATNPDTNVRNWKGSKLKKWAIEGERHFAPADTHQAQELVGLVTRMLSADPNDRPSFHQCYDQLAQILQELSPSTLEQLVLLFDYFDYISTYCELEDEIDRLLRVAVIPSQRKSVQADIRRYLRDMMEDDVVSLESALRAHHLSKALHGLCCEDCAPEDKELLAHASELVVRFVLVHHESITAECLWRPFPFRGPEPKKLCSDIEAKAEILNTCIERLRGLDAYDKQLQKQVDDGGRVIQACRVLNDASNAWQTGSVVRACDLLDQVRQLVPHEPELESLYNRWTSTRDLFAG